MHILATLRSLAMNALRLEGFWSITEGLAALSMTLVRAAALGIDRFANDQAKANWNTASAQGSLELMQN